MPVLHGERVTLRPLEDEHLEPLAAVIGEPSVARWWGESDEPERLRENLRNDGAAWAIEVDGEVAGWLGVSEETDPDYRHAGLDISLSERFQGRGLGPEALLLAIRWLIDERGHHRLTIDPNAANERAIRAYEAVGFKRVGIMRQYERRTDGLLMDLLADELPPLQ